ncbi:ring finger protein 121 [Columba livia]|uniref:Ring finger protein 121 n=1 Tax=Columba livia TaxID=8932 RepID=A0A2I0LJW4_COLLI|nr:ring finger protein 121 [Columba livia]
MEPRSVLRVWPSEEGPSARGDLVWPPRRAGFGLKLEDWASDGRIQPQTGGFGLKREDSASDGRIRPQTGGFGLRREDSASDGRIRPQTGGFGLRREDSASDGGIGPQTGGFGLKREDSASNGRIGPQTGGFSLKLEDSASNPPTRHLKPQPSRSRVALCYILRYSVVVLNSSTRLRLGAAAGGKPVPCKNVEDVASPKQNSWFSVDLSHLSPEERWRVEHARMHAKHRGHEAMHAEMVLILIATLVVAQLLLVQWKQRHPRSYNVS